MYRAISIALASALLILAPAEVLARGGGGGGHGGGGGGHGGGMGGGMGGGGGHASFSGGHMGMGRTFSGVQGPVGFRAMPGVARAMPGAWHGARFNRHVAPHRFHHRKVFFVNGFGSDYYACYPVWNGYAWYNSCDYGY